MEDVNFSDAELIYHVRDALRLVPLGDSDSYDQLIGVMYHNERLTPEESVKDESEPDWFSQEDLDRLNKIIGYKEGDNEQLLKTHERGDVLHTSLEVHMKHNASKLTDALECLAELSCENLDCFIKLFPEAKVFDLKLGSYQLSSPNGLLAESASAYNSLVGVFCYKPFDVDVDWSLVAKASPCYVTYLKDSMDQIINCF
ncbi:hypothetical protein F0562_025577 [Nyssa sinensis]|uniref:Uncharacterized protein n=1 Tax=Nyssa sinensis TaxID=561372 RepID=A0A5J5B6P9_9ASTE|nr:hypothetical protein F0562_025577 [Nyssa sinensis]